jgi:hypothetical protein
VIANPMLNLSTLRRAKRKESNHKTINPSQSRAKILKAFLKHDISHHNEPSTHNATVLWKSWLNVRFTGSNEITPLQPIVSPAFSYIPLCSNRAAPRESLPDLIVF